ncbi:hypothetical protein CDAR_567431 [Caerostris darwini]|uniref:Uncharacterized protein n=1 Tax=Caerostris darwini TaxID=1538125 RepID=A0AAV4QWI3_9ARAC|nr:hypothetical protein CDAR_567431 [Caerostris darwini]
MGNSKKKTTSKIKKKCTKALFFESLCTYSISTEANEYMTTVKQHIKVREITNVDEGSEITFKEMSSYEQNHLSNTSMESRNRTPIVNKANLIPIHQAPSCKRKVSLNTLTNEFDKNKKYKNNKSKMEIQEEDEVLKLIELYDPAMGKDITKYDPITSCASPTCEDFSISSISKKYDEKYISKTAKRMLIYNNPFQSTSYAKVNSNYHFRKSNNTPKSATSLYSKKYEQYSPTSRKIAVSEECSINASSLRRSAFLSDRLGTKKNSKSQTKNVSIWDITSIPVCTGRLKSDKNKASFSKKHISANEEESKFVSPILNNMAKLPSSNKLFRKRVDKICYLVLHFLTPKNIASCISKSRKTAVSDECPILSPLPTTKYASNILLNNRVDTKENSKSVKWMLSYKDIPICDVTLTPVSTGRLKSAKSSRTSLYKKGVSANE